MFNASNQLSFLIQIVPIQRNCCNINVRRTRNIKRFILIEINFHIWQFSRSRSHMDTARQKINLPESQTRKRVELKFLSIELASREGERASERRKRREEEEKKSVYPSKSCSRKGYRGLLTRNDDNEYMYAIRHVLPWHGGSIKRRNGRPFVSCHPSTANHPA